MITIRGIEIGTGRPKICVPITGISFNEIMEQAKKAALTEVELIEWRVDYAGFVYDFIEVEKVLHKLRIILEDKVLLFTFRTKREGGEKEISLSEYFKLNKLVAETKLVDLIDIELFSGDEEVKECIEQIHTFGGKVILSNHDFAKTPDEQEIVSRLCKMEELGADILKIAVMPTEPKDVTILLSATCQANKLVKKPVVTMSMSKMGVVSRLTGGVFGSAITFGTIGSASAPGQVPVDKLKSYLEFFE